MSGLELLTRDSKSQIEKNAEAVSVYFSEVYNRDDDERNWSFSYLKSQLLLKNSQDLFRRYQVRVQHGLFVELLAFNLVYNALIFGALLFLPDQESISDVSRGAVETGCWCRSFVFLVNFCMFVAAYKESLFRSSAAKIGAAGIILFCMVVGEMGTSLYRISNGSKEPTIRQTFYIILTTSVLLPFPRKLYCAISGAAVITLDIGISSLSNMQQKKARIVLLADLVFHLTLLFVGLFIRYLIEVMSRRAFLDRRECIESKIKIETEKNQEEKFLHTILPTHIAREVREDIHEAIKNIDGLRMTHKPFNKLYVEKHKNVSILYADIVNSMLLAASLNVSDLVETLNDLFGRFDMSAEKNSCMRIKLLGDCYYCVSGISEKTDRHADNCVNTGLEMIDIIRKVRESRNVNVGMRIGVHTGNVLGGLLGLRKWQFDVWSKDVTIASHMEQGGVPGQVHITKATKDHLVDDWYNIKPGEGHLRDAYILKERIETFLISPIEVDRSRLGTPESKRISNGIHFQRQTSTHSLAKANISRLSKRQSSNDMILPMSRRGAIGHSLNQYRDIVEKVNRIMENTIDKMALSKKDQWFSSVGIQPLLLLFREPGQEKPYLNQPDPLLKHYLICVLVIFLGITLIHVLIMSSTADFWIAYGIVLIIIISSCIIAWIGYIWMYIKKDDNDVLLDSTVLKISRTVWKTTSVRVVTWLFISSMVLFSSIAGLNECLDHSLFRPLPLINSTYTTENAPKTGQDDLSCSYPWYYTLCAALAMTTTSSFLRIHFWLKLALNGVALGVFWHVMDVKGEEIFRQQTAKLADWEEFGFPLDRSHCYYLTFVLLVLHILDRQVEYVCRLDYLMKVKLKAEQEEAKNIELLNRILLYNILPPHVAKFYLNKQLQDDEQRVDVPYHEERWDVAVLFASIPSFADFYYEDTQNEEGLRCIQLLNEIICDFDQLLRQKEFLTVEKIKTIGSTYMAACGLQSQEKGSVQSDENPTQNVVTLAKFAVAMMSALHELNKDAMQDFHLRVGISVGSVMAGVVGTVKPQYDIWGDTVNVASRMDSTGIDGRVQVTKEVADLLKDSDCPFECECRGKIFVKGKGELVTYFLKTPFDEDNIQITVL